MEEYTHSDRYTPADGTLPPLYTASTPAPAPLPSAPLYTTPPAKPARPAPDGAWLAAALLSYIPAMLYIKGMFRLSSEALPAGFLPVFSVLLILGVTLFARAEHRAPCKETPFWALCWLAQSVSLGVFGPQDGPLYLWQLLAFHLFAVWFMLAATGMLAAGKSGSLFFVDALTGLFVLPWPAFFARITTAVRGLAARLRRGRRIPGKTAAQVIISALAAGLLCFFAWEQLAAADANFAAIGSGARAWLHRLFRDNIFFTDNFLYFILSLPVGAWLFGLVAGGLRRRSPPVTDGQFYAALTPLRHLPGFTIHIILGALCGVYALFFGVQAAEFLPLLGAGARRLSAPDAAAFAVGGFWELCRVLLLNFAVLAGIHFFSPRPLRQGKAAKALAAFFCAFGAAFAALALAKLAAYIRLYGFTPRRVVSGWFLCVLTVWAVLALVWVFKAIPAARIGIFVLALSFTVLCCADMNTRIVESSLARYTSGQSAAPALDVLRQCGACYGPRAPEYAEKLIATGWLQGRTPEELSDLYYIDSAGLSLARVPLNDTATLRLRFQNGLCVGAEVERE